MKAFDLSDRVAAELAVIFSTPAFLRAPVIRKLLKFLVVESLAGRGGTLKSYAVAVEGLGRSEDFDPQLDSYPRVQVGRLRKMLDAHYSKHDSINGVHISIPSGHYRVFFDEESAHVAPRWRRMLASLASRWLPSRARRLAAPRTIAAAAAIAAFSGALFMLGYAYQARERWRTPNFPVVQAGPILALDGTPEQNAAAFDFSRGLAEELSHYSMIRVVQGDKSSAPYRIEATLRAAGDGTVVGISLVDGTSGRVVWSRSETALRSDGQLFDFADVAIRTAAPLAQPSGVIHSDQRAQGVSIDTPYGCLLAFLGKWNDRAAPVGRDVKRCVAKWRGADPTSAQAHAASAWLLVQDAVSLGGTRRRDRLAEANAEARLAVEADASNTLGQYAVMNVALHRGHISEMHAAADRIMAINPHNPEFAMMVGLHRILAGDASGEPLLVDALAQHANPPSWAYAGLFFAAVLRDDPPAALLAARRFESTDMTELPLVLLAVAESRNGDLGNARRHWTKALAINPQLASRPDAVYDRWHLSPGITARCLEWLQPALRKNVG